MASLRTLFVGSLLLAAPLLAGCLGGDDASERADDIDWRVGDRWIYNRSSSNGAPDTVYVREVTGLFDKRGHEVFEVTEGIRGHPITQYMLYAIDDLRFMGMEVRETSTLLQRLDPESPIVFHYVFPLEAGARVRHDGIIHQTSGGLQQRDTVHIEADVHKPRDLTLGERIYRVFPYEIRITYTTTPFDETATIRGNWAPTVGQSVHTTIDEAGERRTYELLSFDRAQPTPGGPAYDLVPGLTSRGIERGFDARLDRAGYARYLFHVNEATEARLDFSFPAADAPGGTERIDLAAIRPLGYVRAGVSSSPDAIAEDGVVLHLASRGSGDESFVFHAPGDAALQNVRFEPGHVYELLLASNRGGLSASLGLGPETQALGPTETGNVEVLALNRSRVQATTAPGPQDIRHTVTTFVALPEGARVEGLVYALNHGGADTAIGEVNPTRKVEIGIDDQLFEDSAALYGFYLDYGRSEPFRVDATFRYRADVAVQGVVDYEVGALLLRLVPA